MAQDIALAAVCGTYCPACRFYGEKCSGCVAVKGRPFWVKEYNRDVCRMYGCGVEQKHLEHCGQCPELPCAIFTAAADPSHTPEEARLSREKRIKALKLRAVIGTDAWLEQQSSARGKE